MPGRTIWTVARSCSELTLSEVKKDKHYFIGWGSWLFQIWLKMRKPLNCGEKPMQGLPEAQFKWVITDNSRCFRHYLKQESNHWCHLNFWAQHLCSSTNLSDADSSPARAWKNHEPGIPLSQESHWASLQTQVHKLLWGYCCLSQSPLDQTERTSHSAALQTKPGSCAKGQAKGKVGILILPT